MFANARMYSLNPALSAAWRTLLEWVIARAGVEVTVIDYPAPQPLPALWARSDMACAFMCGYPFARALPQPQLLAAPLPSPARYRGRPLYCTDLVVRADSSIATLAEAWGQRLGFTTPESMSGYQAPRRFFAADAAARGGKLFASVVGPLMTPRGVVDAVLTGAADLGPLDSYAHDLLRRHEPQLAARLRVIASTPFTPMPALVGAAGLDREVAERLRAALLEVEAAAELTEARASLLLRGFARVEPSGYHAGLLAATQADALGYAQLA